MLEDNPRYWPDSISACGGSTGQLLHVGPCLLLAQVSRPRQTPGTYSRSGCLIGSHEFLSFSPEPRRAAAAQRFESLARWILLSSIICSCWADTVWLASISGSQCCKLHPLPRHTHTHEKQQPKIRTVIERYLNELWLSFATGEAEMALTLRPMDLNLCLPLLTRERWRDAVHGPESHKCSV